MVAIVLLPWGKPTSGATMAKKASGLRLKVDDTPTVFGMQARGDREHDIAAWFGRTQEARADL